MKKLLLILILATAMSVCVGDDKSPEQPVTFDEVKAKAQAVRQKEQEMWFEHIRVLTSEQIQKEKKRAVQAMTFYCSSAITNLTADMAIARTNESFVAEEKVEIFLQRCGWMLE